MIFKGVKKNCKYILTVSFARQEPPLQEVWSSPLRLEWMQQLPAQPSQPGVRLVYVDLDTELDIITQHYVEFWNDHYT